MNNINWKRNIIILGAAEFGVRSMAMMIRPFIPFFLPELGVTDPAEISYWTGLLSSINFMAVAIFTPIWGRIADRFGRKSMVVRCVFFLSIFNVLLALTQSAQQFFIIRFLTGMFSGTHAAVTTLLATTTPEQYLGLAIGVIQAAYMAGTLMGPLLGSLLSDLVGYRGSLIYSGLVIFLLLPFILFGIKENFTKPLKKKDAQPDFAKRLAILARSENAKGILLCISILFITQFAMQGNDTFNPLYVSNLYRGSYLKTLVAVSFGMLAGVNILTAAPIGRLSDKKGHVRIIIICLAMYAVCLLAQVVKNLPLLIGLRTIQGALIAGVMPGCYTCITKLTHPDTRGTILGITASFVAMGSFLGPNICGIIGANIGIRAIFIFLSILIGFIFIASMIFQKKINK
jgi:DHA1 family multidrug resistance protein-like MFS transporter